MRIALLLGVVCYIGCMFAGLWRFIINKKKGKSCSWINLLIYLFFPLTEIILLTFVCSSNANYTAYHITEALASIILGVMGTLVLIEYLIDTTLRKDLDKEHIDLINSQNSITDVLAQTFLEKEKAQKDKEEFLLKVEEIMDAKDISLDYARPERICENSYVNVILQNKKAICKGENIKFETDVDIKEDMGIDSLALCSVFLNLIDNAINACKVYEGDNKFIRIKSHTQGNILLINVVNSADRKSKVVDKSRKHYGKQIIAEYAKQYDGYVKAELNLKAGTYEADVMMQEKK